MPLNSYVWDLSNPNVPESELLGPSQLVCAKFNVKDANLVGAGQYNGQFSYFDRRKGSAPVDSTPMDVCHRSARASGSRHAEQSIVFGTGYLTGWRWPPVLRQHVEGTLAAAGGLDLLAQARMATIAACRDPVFDFAWLQSKTGSEALTVSTDGQVLWWDIRKLSEVVESMPLR